MKSNRTKPGKKKKPLQFERRVRSPQDCASPMKRRVRKLYSRGFIKTFWALGFQSPPLRQLIERLRLFVAFRRRSLSCAPGHATSAAWWAAHDLSDRLCSFWFGGAISDLTNGLDWIIRIRRWFNFIRSGGLGFRWGNAQPLDLGI